VFHNFKDQIACIIYAMEKNAKTGDMLGLHINLLESTPSSLRIPSRLMPVVLHPQSVVVLPLATNACMTIFRQQHRHSPGGGESSSSRNSVDFLSVSMHLLAQSSAQTQLITTATNRTTTATAPTGRGCLERNSTNADSAGPILCIHSNNYSLKLIPTLQRNPK